MKKILRYIRNCIVLILWTISFIYIFGSLIYFIWNFNITSASSWQAIINFWNRGGIFKTPSDIILMVSLFLLPFMYIFGFIKAKNFNYFKMLSSLYSLVFKEKIDDPQRVVIKGLKTTQQMVEDIKNEIASLKPAKTKEAGSIRSSILKKLNEEIKK